jgi:hypothetical protein
LIFDNRDIIKCTFDSGTIEHFCKRNNILTNIFITSENIPLASIDADLSLGKLFTKFADNKRAVCDRLYKKTKPIVPEK